MDAASAKLAVDFFVIICISGGEKNETENCWGTGSAIGCSENREKEEFAWQKEEFAWQVHCVVRVFT
jgi:hypothetical protein